MNDATALPPPANERRFMPLLLLLFFGSGCAALIYEIVWFQLLQLVIGSSAVSLGILLGVFMGGMCLGSLLLPKFVSARRSPLRVYAALEVGIGLIGLASPVIRPLVSDLYVTHAATGLPGLLLRGLVCAVCLLPPTILMGATLPAISRWVETSPRGVSWLGFFYGSNIAGAVFGSLAAGFYLLRLYDMATAVIVAAAINGTVAGLAVLLDWLAPSQVKESVAAQSSERTAGGSKLVYIAIALSGMTALGAEVIWTRLLSLLLGATVYTFSIILAVFLVGLGIGSGLGSFIGREVKRPRALLGICQLLLAAGIGWTAWMLGKSVPFWPINPSLSTSPWFNFQLDLARCCWAILPPTILWGASFPLALAAAGGTGDPGKLVGRVYAANTLGAIIGALATSILLVQYFGTQHSQQILVAAAGLSGALLLAPEAVRGGSVGWVIWRNSLLTAGLAAVAAIYIYLPETPWQLVAHGRYLPTFTDDRKLLYMGEGITSSVAVTELYAGNIRQFHVSGKVEASSDPRDMRLQRMLGHLPALVHPHPGSVLVVGCGAGVTAGSFLTYPTVTNITICEIEPFIPQHVAGFFSNENYDVVNDPRVHIVYDDARHFVETTRRKFDIITSDPIHPWVKGAATLYTAEYFQMCKEHLNPGGLVTQWVPLYESDEPVVKSEVGTFFNVFTNGTIWGNDDKGAGYDTVVMGSEGDLKIDPDELEDRLGKGNYLAAGYSLQEVGFNSAMQLLVTYAGSAEDLKPWLEKAEINRDSNLRLQYLAGMSPDDYQESEIYDNMIRYRRFPTGLFEGSTATKDVLRQVIEIPAKRDK